MEIPFVLLLLLHSLSGSMPISPPNINPTSWTASDDFAWDSSVDVPKGSGSNRNTLVIPSTVDGLVLKCNASYPVEWIFHHSQLSAHSVQRNSNGRWWTTVSTIRKSKGLFDISSFEYIAELRFQGSSNGITGNYTCQKVDDESVSRSKYVFWEANSPPFLIQQGQNNTAVLNPSTNTTVLTCTVARPDILVALYKFYTNGSVWTELKKNESVQYDSKQGFTLINLRDPFGQYKCVANSDQKDFTTIHVVPNTSPEARPPEFRDWLKRPASFGYDKEKQQFFCCSRSTAPSMMHFYCDHPVTCKLRKNSLLNMENTATRNGSCSSVRLFLQNAGVFRCVGDGIDIVRQYFFPMGFQFGFRRNRNRTAPDPYYSWQAADPNKMVQMRTWNSDKIYVGQNVTFACQASNYYFSRGIRWRIGYKNGAFETVEEQLVNDTKRYHHQWFRRNINSIVVTADLNLTSVSCYAPVWNTSEWKNQSMTVKAKVPAKPIILGGTSSETVIEWYVNETNKIMDCEATGDPLPSLSWKKDKKSFYKYTRKILNNGTSVRSVVNISRVSYEAHGEYVCTAKNLAGVITKTYKILVIERTSPGVIITIIISVVLLILSLGGIVYLVIRNKNQKTIINKLAVTAFKEVEAVGGNRVLPVPKDPIFDFNSPTSSYDENSGHEKDEGTYHRI